VILTINILKIFRAIYGEHQGGLLGSELFQPSLCNNPDEGSGCLVGKLKSR